MSIRTSKYVHGSKAYWEHAYWETVYKEGSYISDLRLRNEQQACRIMELELLLSCIRRIGDGVHISHTRIQQIYHLHPDAKKYIGG